MITLFAAIAGFLGSAFPEILKLIRDKNDKKHELNVLEKQIEMHRIGINSRLEEISTIAHVLESRSLYKTYKTGVYWVDALNGTVRPVLAYSFFLLYGLIKYLQFKFLFENELLPAYIENLWSLEDQAIFAGIISFYFGQRAINKLRNVK